MTALSPEAERPTTDELVAEVRRRFAGMTFDATDFELAPHVMSPTVLLVLLSDAVTRLLRSPVASTTLPGEPSEAAIAKAHAAAEGMAMMAPSTSFGSRGYDYAYFRAVLRAAYAVDGSPVASLAPTSLADRPECVEAAVMAWRDEAVGTPSYGAMQAALVAAEAARPPKGA